LGMSLSDIISMVAVSISGIATVTSIIALHKSVQASKTLFDFFKVDSIIAEPASVTALIVSNPTKPIEKCIVYCNKIALPCDKGDSDKNWCYVHAGGSALFHIPWDSNDDEDSIISVKDGNRTLRKATKLREIPKK
jgi:hypothetical protein